MAAAVEWVNGHYELQGDKIVRNSRAFTSAKEEVEIYDDLARYIESRILVEHKFESYSIPPNPEGDGAVDAPSTSVLATPDLTTATKLLIIIQNASGSQMGIFSRSLCLDQGISKGSMLPYIEHAIREGYAVLILRPNTNSVTLTKADGTTEKVLIRGSESPEIHALCVWENVVPLAKNVSSIALLGYGNGASLCHDLFLRSKVQGSNLIQAFATIEASHIVEEDDPNDVQSSLADLVVNVECSPDHAKGHVLDFRRKKIGVTSVSMGMPTGVQDLTNVAICAPMALETIFSYFTISLGRAAAAAAGGAAAGGDAALPASELFVRKFVADNLPGVARKDATVTVASGAASGGSGDVPPGPPSASPPPSTRKSDSPSVFSKLFGFSSKKSPAGGASGSSPRGGGADDAGHLTVADFDLLRIVGKGGEFTYLHPSPYLSPFFLYASASLSV